MGRVDYDAVASTYDLRYDRNRFDGVRDALLEFTAGSSDILAAEVGCGTGHWLAELAGRVRTRVGIEPSAAMLAKAVGASSKALLIRGRAEAIPLASSSADRLFCINAVHHFTDHQAFAREARRILKVGGRVMIVGLDPHTGSDRWWIYDFFPSALEADRQRYPSTRTIRALLEGAGFVDVSTSLAQHLPASVPYARAVERGYLERASTSQLMVISDAAYASGMQRISAEQPVLVADLRLFATIGRVPPAC